MIKNDDPIKIWEEDGDLERVRDFWNNLIEEHKKEKIKQLVLAKLAEETTGEVSQPEDLRWETPAVDPAAGDGTRRGKFFARFRANGVRQLQRAWQRVSWKAAIPVAALALIIVIGQTGILSNAFKGSKPELAVEYQSAGVASGMGTVAPDGQWQTFDSEGAERDSLAKSKVDVSFTSGISPIEPLPEAPPADESLPRKITYRFYASVQVDDVQAAVDQLHALAQSVGGYVVDSQIENHESSAYARLTLKIPEAELAGVRKQLADIGKVLSQHLQANDITNQYYDAEARLRNYEAQEARYLEILKEADTVEDILQVENALNNVRMQIEQLKGQLKLWDHQIAYSTVDVELHTKQNPVAIDDPWQPMALADTWEACQRAVLKSISTIWNGFNYLIVGIGYALPVVVLGGGGYLIFRQWRKRKKATRG